MGTSRFVVAITVVLYAMCLVFFGMCLVSKPEEIQKWIVLAVSFNAAGVLSFILWVKPSENLQPPTTGMFKSYPEVGVVPNYGTVVV